MYAKNDRERIAVLPGAYSDADGMIVLTDVKKDWLLNSICTSNGRSWDTSYFTVVDGGLLQSADTPDPVTNGQAVICVFTTSRDL